MKPEIAVINKQNNASLLNSGVKEVSYESLLQRERYAVEGFAFEGSRKEPLLTNK